MSTSRDSPPSSPWERRLYVPILIVAILETLNALSNLVIFGDLSEYRDSGFAQWLLIAAVAIYPVPALAALIFAIKADLRRAVMALAAIVIVAWFMDYLPSFFVHGLEFLEGGITGLHLFAMMVVFPLLAVVALVLAYRRQRLVLAAVLASLTTVANVLAIVAFAVGVWIYGF